MIAMASSQLTTNLDGVGHAPLQSCRDRSGGRRKRRGRRHSNQAAVAVLVGHGQRHPDRDTVGLGLALGGRNAVHGSGY